VGPSRHAAPAANDPATVERLPSRSYSCYGVSARRGRVRSAALARRSSTPTSTTRSSTPTPEVLNLHRYALRLGGISCHIVSHDERELAVMTPSEFLCGAR
jgi:hypothetical protein